MDRAPRQVMIEVTVAEVTLSNDEEFGVAWLAKNDLGKFDGQVSSGTIGGLGGSGLSYLLDIGGQTRASLKALASRDRITVLSTPRLMVKSGEEANTTSAPKCPPSGVAVEFADPDRRQQQHHLQTVQYRKHGSCSASSRWSIRMIASIWKCAGSQRGVADRSRSAVNSPAILNRSISTRPQPGGRQRDPDGGLMVRSGAQWGTRHSVSQGRAGAGNRVQDPEANEHKTRWC